MLIDLSHPIHDGMQTFPGGWHPNVCFETLGRLSVEQRRTTRVTLGTHTGTHLDAPSHFLETGATIDEIPLDLLVGRTQRLDMQFSGPRQQVTKGMLQQALGDRELSRRVVLDFGWSYRFNTSTFYTDSPYLNLEAAEWIIESGVQLLGYDTASPDNPLDTRDSGCDSPIHKALLGSGVWLLEYLRDLDKLGESFDLWAMPLPLLGLDGAPTRCLGHREDH
jgi:arylformamidase